MVELSDASYVLGHSEFELNRLEAQARLIDPITRRFLLEAGIKPGMRVLDSEAGRAMWRRFGGEPRRFNRRGNWGRQIDT